MEYPPNIYGNIYNYDSGVLLLDPHFNRIARPRQFERHNQQVVSQHGIADVTNAGAPGSRAWHA
jgi:hypothetical protein